MGTDDDSFQMFRTLASHGNVSQAEKNPSLCVVKHGVMKTYGEQEV